MQLVPVSSEEGYYLERTWDELQALKTLIIEFTCESDFVPNAERYEQMMTYYVEAYAAYHIAWQYLLNKYGLQESDIKQFNFTSQSFEIIK